MADGEKTPFDEAKEAEQNAAQIEDLKSMVSMADGADGQSYPVSKLDCIHSQWRQTAVRLLKLLNPEAYAEYRKMKYANGPNPDLAARKAAYMFAFEKFMEFYGIAGF